MVSQLLVAMLRQHHPCHPQYRHRVLPWRPQHVDRVVALAVRHHEPVIVGHDNSRLSGGTTGRARVLGRAGSGNRIGAGCGPAAIASENHNRLGEERDPDEQRHG
jgi:hypothetical protein